MSNPPEAASYRNSTKVLTLLPLSAIYFYSLHYETPCMKGIFDAYVLWPFVKKSFLNLQLYGMPSLGVVVRAVKTVLWYLSQRYEVASLKRLIIQDLDNFSDLT